jgi:hypothetical protein
MAPDLITEFLRFVAAVFGMVSRLAIGAIGASADVET